MSKYLINGLWAMEQLLYFKPMLCYLHTLVQTNYYDFKSTYFELNFFERALLNCAESILFLMRFNVFRWYANCIRIFSIWMIRTFPIVAYLKFGVQKATVNINI